MVTTSRSGLWDATWAFQDHGSTHEAVFRSRAPAGLLLAAAHPALSGSCSEIDLETCFKDAGLAPAEPLPVARQLGDTSLMFLVHPTITPEQMAGFAVDCSSRPARLRWRSESGSDRGARWRIGASGARAAVDALSPHPSATALDHRATHAGVARGLRHRDPDHGPLRLVAAPLSSSVTPCASLSGEPPAAPALGLCPRSCPQTSRLWGADLPVSDWLFHDFTDVSLVRPYYP